MWRRLLFEISHLRNASPATVSRAGVLYINEHDVGWAPFVQTWIDSIAKLDSFDHKTVAISVDITLY